MKEKIKNILLVIMVLSTIGSITFAGLLSKELDFARSSLTAMDAEIQRLDVELGVSESKLTDVSELNKKYEDEISKFPKKLREIIDSYELKIKSRDKTIASLKNTISGGTTIVEVTPPTDKSPQKISYKWTDKLNRFNLSDPDIFEKNNEEFSYKQHISIKGYVFYGKDGKLQIRKVNIQEVVPDGTGSDGKPKFAAVDGGNMELVDSTFEYADINNNDKKLWHIIHPRLVASMDSGVRMGTFDHDFRPGIGVEVVNLGRYIDYANVGLTAKLVPNFDDLLAGSILKTRLGVGVNYTIIPPILDTNFGLGMSVTTPSNNLLNEWYVTVDALFYLTN